MTGAPPPNPWLRITGGTAGPDYAARFAALAAAGEDLHGEARRVHSLLAEAPGSIPTDTAAGGAEVLDAGCGTGRVAIHLAALGHRVVGVDLDASMLAEAAAAAPGLEWIHADLAELDLGRQVDVVVAAGNLWPLLTPGSHAAVLARLAAHLRPDGLLVAGFGLDDEHVPFALPGGTAFPTLADWDSAAAAAGLTLVTRTADWDGQQPYRGGGYAVSVHRSVPASRRSDPARHVTRGEP